mgnify:CR=1 FL=1
MRGQFGRWNAKLSLDPADLARVFAQWGFKPSHAARLLRRYYATGTLDEAATRGMPADLNTRLHVGTAGPELARRQGEVAREVNEALAKRIAARKMLANASYFAFTATPKNKTLEMFGDPLPPDAEGKVKPSTTPIAAQDVQPSKAVLPNMKACMVRQAVKKFWSAPKARL